MLRINLCSIVFVTIAYAQFGNSKTPMPIDTFAPGLGCHHLGASFLFHAQSSSVAAGRPGLMQYPNAMHVQNAQPDPAHSPSPEGQNTL